MLVPHILVARHSRDQQAARLRVCRANRLQGHPGQALRVPQCIQQYQHAHLLELLVTAHMHG